MKKLLLASVGVLALSVPSYAADLAARPYTKAPPPVVAPVPSWNGFYIGGFGGYGWSNEISVGNVFIGGTRVTTDELNGAFGGGTIGFNWQAPGSQFVWGIEVDVAGSDIGAGDSNGLVSARDRIDVFGSVTGRLGVAFNSALLYVKGGYGWANNQIDVDAFGVNVFSQSNTHSGWTVGAGLEYLFAPNWSAKVEYQYYDFGSQNYASGIVPGGIDLGASIHTVKAGINYHFNWGAPLAPGY
jgi:outer membrane immunogenic protein